MDSDDGEWETREAVDMEGLWQVIVELLPEDPAVLVGVNAVLEYVWAVSDTTHHQQPELDMGELARWGMGALAIVSQWYESMNLATTLQVTYEYGIDAE